jgi:hypothetical protein
MPEVPAISQIDSQDNTELLRDGESGPSQPLSTVIGAGRGRMASPSGRFMVSDG